MRMCLVYYMLLLLGLLVGFDCLFVGIWYFGFGLFVLVIDLFVSFYVGCVRVLCFWILVYVCYV